jgi:hypothetical protein
MQVLVAVVAAVGVFLRKVMKMGGKQPSCYVLVVQSMHHEELYLVECKSSDKYLKDTLFEELN